MSIIPNTKIELKEIKNRLGNLCFAEENNPIPFDIKCVFWTTIKQNQSIQLNANAFIIALDGKININSSILDKPNQGYYSTTNTSLNILLTSEEATLLIVMDKKIDADDKAQLSSDQLMSMPQIKNNSGLSGHFANSNQSLPFDIKRVYFTYNIPDFAERGGHAHIETTSLILAVKGGFEISLDNCKQTKKYQLSSPTKGLFIDKGLWRELNHFKNKSLLLVFTSDIYSEKDYIRDYNDFRNAYQ